MLLRRYFRLYRIPRSIMFAGVQQNILCDIATHIEGTAIIWTAVYQAVFRYGIYRI